ncbi:MAG: neutral zinc metallopeptidase [Spirochaetaceae bacterium]|nr:neutral zinc metallopeptidase [Myxococcales bacterium]MCB9725093.1 neutral zinc metallopeptidase [Spirochaetaceae bacterium]
MRWERGERSENLEDRRAEGGGRPRLRFPRSGSGARIPIPAGRGGRLSLTSILVMLALAWFLGLDPMSLLGGLGGGGLSPDLGARVDPDASFGGAPPRSTPQEEEQVDFVSFVLDDLQSTWGELLPGYRDAKLVLFRDATQSGCGVGQSEMGPFYCPADEKVYVDLAFYDELRQRFGAPGDFAQAYVLAHEVGHHIQRLTGLEQKVRAAQQRSPDLANELSVRMELQADCLAGVWGRHADRRGVLEPGDIDEGLRAAAAIGDDRIQKMSGRGVHPESWTHGSSAQRQEWLHRGLETGDPDRCDTFGS